MMNGPRVCQVIVLHPMGSGMFSQAGTRTWQPGEARPATQHSRYLLRSSPALSISSGGWGGRQANKGNPVVSLMGASGDPWSLGLF